MSNEIVVAINQRPAPRCCGCIYWTKSKDTGAHYCRCFKSPFYLRTTDAGCPLKETEKPGEDISEDKEKGHE